MLNNIIRFEELSMNAHPAIKTQLFDGWVLRFADGYTNRANSVNPLYLSSIPIEEKIAFCEDSYTAQGLPTVFKLTPLSADALDKTLEMKGYEKVTPTNIMVKALIKQDQTVSNTMISQEINEIWQDHYFRLNGVTDNHNIRTAAIIQGNIQNKVLCGRLEEKGKTAACGLCVIEGNYAGLFDIIVDSTHRGEGFGYNICTSLLNNALMAGAKTAYLQVVAENKPALALYHKLGFECCYQYWYRVKK